MDDELVLTFYELYNCKKKDLPKVSICLVTTLNVYLDHQQVCSKSIFVFILSLSQKSQFQFEKANVTRFLFVFDIVFMSDIVDASFVIDIGDF